MKKFLFILFALFTVSAFRTAGSSFYVSDPSLGNAPQSVVNAIKDEGDWDGYDKCKFVGKLLPLTDDPKEVFYAATTNETCSRGVAEAPIWLARITGTNATILMETSGTSLTVGAEIHNNMPDLTISGGSSEHSRSGGLWLFSKRDQYQEKTE